MWKFEMFIECMYHSWVLPCEAPPAFHTCVYEIFKMDIESRAQVGGD